MQHHESFQARWETIDEGRSTETSDEQEEAEYGCFTSYSAWLKAFPAKNRSVHH